MMRVLLLLLLGVSLSQGWDLRKITCHSYFGKWDCWWSQTCGDQFYQCNGGADDMPPFSAIAFDWIIGASVIAILVIIGLIVLVICIVRKGLKCCC